MLKNILTAVCSLLLIFQSTFAQGPVLTGPDLNPQALEIYRYYEWSDASASGTTVGEQLETRRLKIR